MSLLTDRAFVSRITEPNFVLAVQMGLIPGFSTMSKFAENPLIASAVPADIWDFGPVEPIYTFSSTLPINTISSSDAADDQLMVVEGLDFVTWEEVIQTVSLNGQNKVLLDTPLIRCYRSYNANGTRVLGNVYIYEDTPISGGIPVLTNKVRAYVAAVEQQTMMGIYTIPAGKTGYFLGLTASLSKKQAASAVFTGSARGFDGVFRTQTRFSLSSVGSSFVDIPSTAFSVFPEKTDFLGNADASVNDVGVTVTFDLLLVDNSLL